MNVARVLCGAILVLCCAMSGFAKDYTVGDATGWTTGVDYTTWTSEKTFAVGDTLVFNYGGGHTVDEVSSRDYSTCTVGNSITTDSSGATSIPLKTPGNHYFICGAAGHCGSGMKVSIKVGGAATSPTTGGGGGTSSTTSPSTTTTPNTLTPKTTTTAMYSSSSVLSPSLAILLLTVVTLYKLSIY